MHPIGKRALSALRRAWPVSAAVVAFCAPWAARAYVTDLPASLAPEILSETVPTAFSVFDLTASDYRIEWAGGHAPEGVEAGIVPGSVQWVRVADVLSLPRARLAVSVSGAEQGRLSNAGFSQAFERGEGAGLKAELPVALISGERNPIEISFMRAGKLVSGVAYLSFRPREGLGGQRVFYDPSCSHAGVQASGTAQSASARGWAYVGCRISEVFTEGHRTSSLEAWVFWDGIGQSLLVGGVPTPSSSVSVWPLRLRSSPGHVQLAVDGLGDEMVLSYATPERYHRGTFSMGLGPYWDQFNGNGEFSSTPTAVLTLYGSYRVTEAIRVVAFGATVIDTHLTTDLGFYLSSEYVRFLDKRFYINLLLGAHAVGFISQGQYFYRLAAPQGAEITYVDFLERGHNLSAGLFAYPLINGISYYNLWLRWGTPQFFAEINYISWDEPVGDGVHADTAGISVGMPLLKFL